MTVQKRLVDYIKKMGTKYSHISENAHIAQNKVSLIMSMDRKITLDEFEKICEVLEVSPMMFLRSSVSDDSRKLELTACGDCDSGESAIGNEEKL